MAGLSKVLSAAENEAVVQMFDQQKCKVEAAGVVQLFMTEPPHNNCWIKEAAGVATLMRDSSRRGYFLQVVDIEAAVVIFEQEVYREFEYHSDVAFFHQFEGEDRMVGFNFADDKDAKNFQKAVINLLQSRQKKREERQRRLMKEEEMKNARQKQRQQEEKIKQQQQQQQLQQQQFQQLRQEDQREEHTKEKGLLGRLKKEKKNKKKTKLTIGDPYNFQHVSHAGFDSNFNVDEELMGLFKMMGMENPKEDDKKFVVSYLKEKGQLEEAKQESRRYTMKIREGEGRSQRSPPQPPVPPSRSLAPPLPGERRSSVSRSRTSSTSSSTSSLSLASSRTNLAVPPPPPLHVGKNGLLPPTPPPSRRPTSSPSSSSSSSSPSDYTSYSIPPPPQHQPPLPPPPLSSSGNAQPFSSSHAPPPPPLPPLPTSGGPPPPPPPPPLPSAGPLPPRPPPPPSGAGASSSAPPPGDTRSALLEQIRNTGSRGLKKGPPPPPPSSSSSSSGNSHSQLMEDIRSKEFKLHHVETPVEEKDKPPALEGLALDLHRALQERAQFIQPESDDSDDDDEDTDDDEWDD